MKGPTLAILLACAPLASAQERFLGQQLGAPWDYQDAPVVQDFDGDGQPDLVSQAMIGNVIWLRLQRGDGAGWVLATEDQIVLPAESLIPVALDADLDGDLDAIVHRPGQATVAPNDGAGHFVLGGSFAYAHAEAGPLASADLNQDGRADLVAVHTLASLASSLLGDGAGGFGPALPVAIDAGVERFVLTDFTGDGPPDLVLPNADTFTFQFLPGNGAGGFLATQLVWAGIKTATVAVGDVNGDGVRDLVGGRPYNFGPGSLTVVRATPTGFEAPTLLAAKADINELSVHDMDHDGLGDLLVTFEDTADGVQVLRSTAGGTEFPVLDEQQTGLHPRGTRAIDLEGDGELDVVCTTGDAILLHGAGGGLFVHPAEVPSHPNSRALLLADVTGDGARDLIAASNVAFNPGPHCLTLYEGDGRGGFGPGLELPNGDGACSLLALDIDADGQPEILAAQDLSHDLLILHRDGASWTSMMPGGWPWFAWNQQPESLAAGDLNGDGLPDLLVAKRLPKKLSIIFATAPGAFAAPLDMDTGVDAMPNQALLGDFDDDGDLDVAWSTNGGEGSVKLLLNHGAGVLATASVVGTPIPWSPPLAAADFNLDGHLDVATAYGRVLLGNGAGQLVATAPLQQSAELTTLSVADIDGDGLSDLIGAESDGRVSVLRGTGTGLASWIGIGSTTEVRACAVADLDGDLRPDIVAGGVLPGITVHLNHATAFPWTPLGGALAGGSGTPVLTGHGALTAGSQVDFTVDAAAPSASSTLVVGLSALGAPFKGGVMWPHPDLVLSGVALDADGYLHLSAPWPAGVPSGLQIWLQDWIPDAGGPHGWSATNGLLLTMP